MSSVFVVEVGAYSDRYISAIFATRELAEQYVIAHVANSWNRIAPRVLVSPGSFLFSAGTTTVTQPVFETQPLPDPSSMPFKEWREAIERLTGNWNEFGDVDEYELFDTLPVVDP